MQKRDIKFFIFWLKRPLKSRILRFFLKTRFFSQKTFKIIDFLSFFLVGRSAVRPLAFCRILGVFFMPFFHDLHLQIAFFKLRYIAFFLMYATTLRTLNLTLRFLGKYIFTEAEKRLIGFIAE